MRIWLISLFCLLMLGCSSKEAQIAKAIEQEIPIAEQKVTALRDALESGQVRNALTLREYAKLLKQQRPELRDLVEQLALDAGSSGPMFKNLQQRLEDAKNNMGFSEPLERLQELESIEEAAVISSYNDALSDQVNVLADLSQGKLARVNAVSREAEMRANGQTAPPASQLVGNPNYGHWTTDSRGMSFWEWYGMYALFSNVMDFGGRRYYYDDWSRRRSYSYYHDYGRQRYSSPSTLKQQAEVETRTKKSFERQGKQFQSPYAKQKTGASGLSQSSKRASSYSRSSSFAKSSSYASKSSSSNSQRSGSSRRSRGVSRGK